MAKLYADEQFPRPVVEALRRFGHHVTTVQEAGQAGADDPDVLAFAIANQLTVLTQNRRDFSKLHQRILTMMKSLFALKIETSSD